MAVSAASGASQASGESEPSVSAQIRGIGEEKPGLRGRFLQDVGPNQVVLEAQARVCTGPTLTRPFGEEEMRRVMEQILLLVCPQVFCQVCDPRRGEAGALRYHLPRDVLFLADPQMGARVPCSTVLCLGQGSEQEAQLVGNLRDILFRRAPCLSGNHVSAAEHAAHEG
ncbi:unnamed protein product [Closterium sp. Yama58-4]|nr:unnamed protein product [Closterium sp. Yama58-4]